jgi:type II secretory pathway pseudopilin PulG
VKRESRPSRPEAGFSLVQVILAATVLTLAALSLSAVQISSMALSATNRETAHARQAARQVLEEIGTVPADEVFATFNTAPSDDPEGAGTAPGPTFSIPTDTGPMQVDVVFPGSSGAVLREDVTDTELGMPRDLNGDGTVDDVNHAGDYLLLPVRIRVTWQGVTGTRSFEMHTVILSQ